MSFSPQEALHRTIEHREIFFDEMVDLMRQIMRGDVSPMMTAAILTGLRVKKETVDEIWRSAMPPATAAMRWMRSWKATATCAASAMPTTCG